MNPLAPLLALLCLPQAETRTRGVGELYRPGEERVWAIEQGGQRIGHCASTYAGEVGLGALRAHRFVEQVELAPPGSPIAQRFTVELWTDAEGLPLRFDLRAQVGDVRSGASGVLAGGQAELVVRQGPGETPMTLEVPAEAFFLANNFVSELELLLALHPPGDEPARHALFFATVLRVLPYTIERASAGEALVLEDSLGERIRLAPDGRLERVELPAQGVVFRRVSESVPRFTIEFVRRERPADLAAEEVRIVDGAASLAGTITRPKGVEGRLPGLLFLSGSGTQDRDGFAAGLDLGTHAILDHLTRAGFLVLRVDDRGAGGSTGPLAGLTFDDLVEDGRRALRFLRARADVDPTRVGLIGHSEGGVSGPILASEEPVAALVLLAAPGRPVSVLFREQLLHGRAEAGATAEQLAAFGAEIDAFLAHLVRGEPVASEGLAGELAAFLPERAWLASHVGRDPLAHYARLACPVLVLQGARDVQVSVERDAPRIVAALEAAGNRDHRLVVFPELDHLFLRASESPSELDYLKARPADAEFLQVLTEWLRARLAP